MGTVYGTDDVHISLACVHANKLHVSQLCIAVRHARLTWLIFPVQEHLVLLLWACVESCLAHRGLETDRKYLGPNKLFRDMSPVTCFLPRCPPPLFPQLSKLYFSYYLSFAPKQINELLGNVNTHNGNSRSQTAPCVSLRHVSQ